MVADTLTIEPETPIEDTVVEVPEVPAGKNVYMPVEKGSKYYVVAGCFKIERNADRYAEKLRSKGFNAQKFGMYRGFHAVCFDSYSTRQEGLQKLRQIRQDVEPKAWMLYYTK
ncbi:MAG: hypothetical protein HC896_05935 [Bacteroidales bacterium]|nr:hypothetical protein [Bacteroidales bacterium]